ncbi:hypothetical protein MUK42_07289 [Musa troglodytarum]|uniref:Uncharacterized protein n=1 Tax=Musa troglodytarum TaxID=320322 RepID=A0A9E7HJP6_9LILI|nr:hypothetical protein MUK42_07289 [Musa troglodytarum]
MSLPTPAVSPPLHTTKRKRAVMAALRSSTAGLRASAASSPAASVPPPPPPPLPQALPEAPPPRGGRRRHDGHGRVELRKRPRGSGEVERHPGGDGGRHGEGGPPLRGPGGAVLLRQPHGGAGEEAGDLGGDLRLLGAAAAHRQLPQHTRGHEPDRHHRRDREGVRRVLQPHDGDGARGGDVGGGHGGG